MVHTKVPAHHGRGAFTNWLNRKLLPVLGPPPLGPYDEPPRSVAQTSCPLCGHRWSEHTVDHSDRDSLLICPAHETKNAA